MCGEGCSCATLTSGGRLCRKSLGDRGNPTGCTTDADCGQAGVLSCTKVDDCCKPPTCAGIGTTR